MGVEPLLEVRDFMTPLPETASELLSLFYLLPESEQALTLERLTLQIPFDDHKFSENYLGFVIEIYRDKADERINGAERWGGDSINSEGERLYEGGGYHSFEECLEAVRAAIDWVIEQEEMIGSFEGAIKDFKEKGYTQSHILMALNKALKLTLDDSDWKKDLIHQIQESFTKAAKSECPST